MSGLPDVKGREDILKVHARGKPLGDDVDLKSIARGTAGFAGADLENLLNEAAILAHAQQAPLHHRRRISTRRCSRSSWARRRRAASCPSVRAA
ncbi:MAG: hypothetical protein ACLUNO_03710 [Oscillospiraceae bacterium]